MTSKQSAGILLYRRLNHGVNPNQSPGQSPGLNPGPSSGLSPGQNLGQNPGQSPGLEVFLVHPGGPFWKNKDAGVWTIPKGEFTNAEPALDAAVREFREETGVTLNGPFQPLSPIRQKGGKRVYAWASPGDLDPTTLVSNTFELEWPRGSGRSHTFPEVDRGGWFTLTAAREYINPAQIPLLEELEETIA